MTALTPEAIRSQTTARRETDMQRTNLSTVSDLGYTFLWMQYQNQRPYFYDPQGGCWVRDGRDYVLMPSAGIPLDEMPDDDY